MKTKTEKAADAEWDRVTTAAWDDYVRAAPARAEYKRVVAAACAEYRRVVDAAQAEYKRVAAAKKRKRP